MAKVTPTTKSCNEICRLITGRDCNHYGKYVQTTYDPTSTHALYGVVKGEVDSYKDAVKRIGGKYIRVVGGRDRSNPYRVICFALEITPQEATKKQMEEDAAKKKAEAYESKKMEIAESLIVQNVGAQNTLAQARFANYLMDGSLDPLLPLESYVLLETPSNKDEKRIYDIVQKANEGHVGCVGMITDNRYKMIELANLMNKKITGEDKRLRRKAACLKYGLKFLAKCFEGPAA
jgi:hypothetical protein